MKAVTVGIVALACSLTMLAGCASNEAKSSTADTSTPQGLYESKCSACHSLTTVDSATYQGTEQWEGVVKRMQQKTKDISDEDVATITDYLANR